MFRRLIPTLAGSFAAVTCAFGQSDAIHVGPPPEGMVWIPGGEFEMGARVNGQGSGEIPMASNDAEPIHRVRVDGFWMDKTEVTNEEFARFVAATGYVTIAEKPRQRRSSPTPRPRILSPARSFSRHRITKSRSAIIINGGAMSKALIGGIPSGRKATSKARKSTRWCEVAYPDAAAYAKWAGKRLPTEGRVRVRRSVEGSQVRPMPGEMSFDRRANSWPTLSRANSPCTIPAKMALPVSQRSRNSPPMAMALYDMAGNVWEWCSDWYRADYHQQLAKAGGVADNPTGPESSFDPAEPNEPKRVQRGGSFLCTDQYCCRYIVGTRGKGEVNTGTNHVGFRCVMTLEEALAKQSCGDQPLEQ